MSLDDELAHAAAMHARYRERLTAEGFTREEAFTLARDHHWLWTWYALITDDAHAGPPWVGPPEAGSSARPSNTGNVYSLSRRPTTPR